MKEIFINGKSLDAIREQVAAEWDCLPEQLELEIIEKPGLFNRSYRVKVILPDEENKIGPDKTTVLWDEAEGGFSIIPSDKVKKIIPFPPAGKLLLNDKEVRFDLEIEPGSVLKFIPESKKEYLDWSIDIMAEGRKAIALVKHQHAGRYMLREDIPEENEIELKKYLTWEDAPDPEFNLTEQDWQDFLKEKGIVHGIKDGLWQEILALNGKAEIVVAEYTAPVPTVQPEIIDYVGEVFEQKEQDEGNIDYFASKLRVCKKGELLAKKIPGKEGIPGINIFGNTIQVEKYNDFTFKVKKNAYLSEDGLEVYAACEGVPIRLDTTSYTVENVFFVNRDVDLTVGSIDFPGDVIVNGNINDGFHIYSGGKVQIQGSASGCEIKAETGLKVLKSIIASKVIVGEKHVFRSQLYKSLQEIYEDLSLCLSQVEQLLEVTKNSAVGQILKVVLEKNFNLLPKKAEEAEKLFSFKDPELVSDELEVAVKTIKRFISGAGPLLLKELTLLKAALKVINYFLVSKEDFVPPSVVCEATYVQNSDIGCAGDFNCIKGVYNSVIRVEGNTQILGVFRGGELIAAGNLEIQELGGSSVSLTTVRASQNSHLLVEYCHANVIIYVGKEVIRIDNNVKKLEIYRDRGILQVEKIKWDGNI